MTHYPSSNRQVLWPQVWGLACVQGAIALAWVIYGLYVRDLLIKLGFAASFASGLLILENVLGMVMEPLMGTFSDRAQRWVGSRFPFIAIGTLAASICFVLIPIVAILLLIMAPETVTTGVKAVLRWCLPMMMVAWALSMTIFRSPALSLLSRYAIGTQLPAAASILTLVGGLAGAMGPLASDVILQMGEVSAFAIGSIVLLVAAMVLRGAQPNQTITEPTSADPASSDMGPVVSWTGLGFVFGAGLGLGLGFRFLMGSFRTAMETQVAAANPNLILGGIFVALALTAIPSGRLAAALGNRIAMVAGLWIMAGLLASVILVNSVFLASCIAFGLGAAYSLVSNGTIPFALSMVSPIRAGLGTGIYFSGAAAASSLFGAIFSGSEAMSGTLGVLVGAAAFGLAGILVAISAPFQLNPPR